MQETHSTSGIEKSWGYDWHGEIFWSHGNSKSRGVAICISGKTGYKIDNTLCDSNGRYIALNASVNDIDLTLVSMYGPNKDDPDFYDKFFENLNSFAKGEIIICGDLNLIFDNTMDKKGGPPHANVRCRETGMDNMTQLVLKDVFRNKNPKFKKFTRIQHRPFTATRIDHILIADVLLNNTTACDILPGILSDHSLVWVEISIAATPRGKGYWKFNNNLLANIDFVKQLKQCIVDYQEINDNGEVNPHVVWETLKCVIRGESIKFSASLKKKKNLKQSDLEIKIEQIKKKLLNAATEKEREVLFRELAEQKEELDQIVADRTAGAMVRSRALWAEAGEKNTRYFLRLENRHAGKKQFLGWLTIKIKR